MNVNTFRLLAMCVASALLLGTRRLGVTQMPASASARSATIALAGGGAQLVTVNPDSGSLSVIDAVTLTKVAEIAVCATPQSIAIAGDTDYAYVVCRDGSLYEVDIAQRRVLRAVTVGYDPFGVVIDGEHLFVSVSGERKVLVIDRQSFGKTAEIMTEEFPRGMAVEAAMLYVTHLRSGRLSVIDARTMRVTRVIGTVADANISQSVVLANGRAYLPQTRSNSSNSALLFDTTAFPIVSVIDLQTGQNLNSARLSMDIIDRPSGIPLDAAITADGRIVVVNAASDDVSIIDLAKTKLVAHVDVGSNPRGLVLSSDEQRAFVNNTLSGSISVIDLVQGKLLTTVVATAIDLPSSVLNGKILFHTSKRATLAKDRWMSCATCHFDGGTDGRTWFFADGLRNTPSLFGAGDTQPSHWTGDLDELQDVENTIRVVQAGSGLAQGDANCTPTCSSAAANSGRSQDLDDLAAYLRALRAPPRPSGLSGAVSRGQRLFLDVRTGCMPCHPAPLYTDQLTHDVGTGTVVNERRGPRFDTPSLRGVFETAPYFHNGSAATLLDIVLGATGAHGDTTMLSESEKKSLAEFLIAIPFADSSVPRGCAAKEGEEAEVEAGIPCRERRSSPLN